MSPRGVARTFVLLAAACVATPAAAETNADALVLEAPLQGDDETLPFVLELRTLLGPVELEFLSLEQVEWRGRLARVLDEAGVEAAPAAVFDRTETLRRFLLALPVASF